jgi:hypothetical protein
MSFGKRAVPGATSAPFYQVIGILNQR